ncbi:hypothetical protein LTR75_001282 [Friedmanniomyces endolithicus]|nr:hypothetical protein LTR75_001282 [Friedmanniomyces endolithicus]
MSTKEAASSSPATSSSATKPSSTAATKPHRLPAPTLFVGPPSRTASQLSVSRQGIDSGKDPLTRQRNNKLGRTTTAETSDAKDGSPNTITANNNDSFPPLPTLRKASEKEADARWREMQSTLNEVELTAQSSTHVFGTQHAAALDEQAVMSDDGSAVDHSPRRLKGLACSAAARHGLKREKGRYCDFHCSAAV